jgi:RNA polymerase sigma-70 factor (ECF subfamily)
VEIKRFVQPDSTDWELVERIQGGADRAFDELMQRYKRPILNFVYRVVGDAAEAEDIALDVFVRAYRTLAAAGFRRSHAAFSTWLFQIARNAALDQLRHQRRHPIEPFTDEDGGAGHAVTEKTARDDVATQETGVQIAAAVALLPDDQRTVLILSAYEDQSYAEIAAIMKCSVKSVEARLYRARQFLRQRLLPLRG